MLKRLGAAATLLLLVHTGGVAQTMRFTTNVGSFDMVLNPNNDSNLQPLVDNLVAYVGLGRYHFSAINRAADGNPGTSDDFVLQMGNFLGFPRVPELWATTHQSIEALNAVTTDSNGDGQVDFTALSNTRGTVSLALSSGGPNSGTSSFFVNLGDNNFLDSQGFVPFARIENMAIIDRILQLTQTDLSDDIGQSGNLAFSDVPLDGDGEIVVITDVDVIQADANFSFTGPIASALQLQARGSAAAASSASMLASSSDPTSAALQAEDILPLVVGSAPQAATPEPSSAALGVFGFFAAAGAARRAKR